MSRWRRLRIGLLVAAVPVSAIAIGGLWGTAEEGGFDADACGSIVHRASDSVFCRSALTETYVEKLVAAIVVGLVVTAVVYGLLTLVRWIRHGRRPTARRRRIEITALATVLIVAAIAVPVAVADHHGPDPCQPAPAAVPVATTDRVTQPLGDAGATGQVAVTAPHGPLAEAWCGHIEVDPEPEGSLPLTAGGVIYASLNDGPVAAFDLATGRSRWTASNIYGNPDALVGDDLVVSGYDQVYDLDVRTGHVRWTADDVPGEAPRDSGVSPGALAVLDGRVYVSSQDFGQETSHLRVLDLATGRARADRTLDSRLGVGDRALVAAGGVVVLPTIAAGQPRSTELEAFDAATLAPRWTAPVDQQVGHLLAADGQVVATADGSDGTELLDFRLVGGQPGWAVTVPASCGLESLLATPTAIITAAAGGGSCAGTVGRDPATGAQRWRGADVGIAWLSRGRVVGVTGVLRTTRGERLQVGSVDAATGGDHQVLASLTIDTFSPLVVGGMVLSSDAAGITAYRAP